MFSLFKKKPIIAKFVVNSQINAKSQQKLLKDIDKAINSKKEIKAVALVINSGGGSACQSSIMGSKVKTFAEKRQAPFYTFAEDVAASGGYWLLASGTEGVYAMKTSMVGSIGVVSLTFNLRNLFQKTQIERPVIQTSENLLQGRLDPLKEGGIQEADCDLIKDIQTDIFKDFKAWVVEHRGDKLAKDKYD